MRGVLGYGIRVDKDHVKKFRSGTVDQTEDEGAMDDNTFFIHRSVACIRDKTSFEIRIKHKEHLPFVGHLLKAPRFTEASEVEEKLLQLGNCILLGICRIEERSKVRKATWQKLTADHTPAETERITARSYKDCAAAVGIDLTGSTALQNLPNSRWLIHATHTGHPHCVPCRFDATGEKATLWNHTTEYVLEWIVLRGLLASAISH